MADIQGSFEDRFAQVAEVLSQSLDAGTDVGASVAIFQGGEPVVDIWGGYADAAKTLPWERDTITNVWSTTKTMTFLAALMLADRGELDFWAPVSRYWPEFAASGKEGVEVRHLMSHTAGLCGWEAPLEPEDLADWDKCTAALAAQAPWWEPGTQSGYHAVTQGYLIGEVIRRITGVSFGTFLRDEIAGPLGADFLVGVPESEDRRISYVIPPPPIDPSDFPNASEILLKTFLNPVMDASLTKTEWWRRAEIPAANGHGNARSVARIQSIVAGRGEAGGVRLLSSAGCDPIFIEQSNGTDLVLGIPIRFGMGYGLASDLMPLGDRACYWGGYGGSLIVVDQATETAVCYVMNKMESGLVGDFRGANIMLAAIAGVLGG
jgi:CubicO group peptidase (beta-lactamase class C family)